MQRFAILFFGLLMLLATFGWTRLAVDTGIEATVGTRLPAVSRLLMVQRDFQVGDQVRVVIDTVDRGAAVPQQAIEDTRAALRGSTELAALGVHPDALPEALVRHWLLEQIPRARGWLDADAVASLRERLEPEAMAKRMLRHRARLATPQPAEVTRQMLRDPLELRDLVPDDLRREMEARPNETITDDGAFEIGRGNLSPPDPLVGLINAQGNAWQCRLSVAFPPSDGGGARRLRIAMAQTLGPLEAAYPELGFYAVGPHLVAAEAASRVRTDMRGSIVFAASGLILVFVFAWRRGAPIVILMLSTGAALYTAFGLYGLSGWQLSPLAALSGGMLAGLGIDHGIHVLTEAGQLVEGQLEEGQFEEGQADEGQVDGDGRQAKSKRNSRRAAAALTRPIVTACATTICGFLALGVTETAAMQQLALLGSLGLLCAGLASLTILPALAGLNFKMTPLPQKRIPPQLGWVVRHPVSMRAAGIVLAIGLVGVLLIPFAGARDSGIYDLHPQPNPVLEAQRLVSDRFGEPAGSVLVHVGADNATELVDKLRAIEMLDLPFTFLSPARLVPPGGQDLRNAKELADLDPAAVGQALLDAAARAGFREEAFTEAAGFIERFLKTPSPGLADLAEAPVARLFLPRRFDPDAPQVLAVLTPKQAWRDHAARRLDLAQLESELAKVPGAEATGLDLLGEQMRRRVRQELTRALLWAAVPLLCILLLSLRSARRVFVTMLPPAMGLLAAAAVLRFGSGQCNAVTLAAVPLLLGIGVDASLFLDHATRSHSLAIIARRVRGIHLTCLTSFVGFGSLTFASIPAVRELGWLMIAGLGAILIATYLFTLPEAAAKTTAEVRDPNRSTTS